MVDARLDHPGVLASQFVCPHDGVLRPVGPKEGVALNGDGDGSEDVGDDDGLPFLPEQIRLLDPLQLDVRPEEETRANVDEKVGGLTKRLQERGKIYITYPIFSLKLCSQTQSHLESLDPGSLVP